MKDLGVSDGGSLFHKSRYIVVDVHYPLVCTVAPYMTGYDFVILIQYDDLLAVQFHHDAFTGKSLWNRVMVILHAYSRLLVGFFKYFRGGILRYYLQSL